MGILESHFFDLVQGADFYVQLHRQAVDLLPLGQGWAWFDAGSGPGLVARLAHDRGYRALGVDRDASMIRQARRRHAGVADLTFARTDLERIVARHGRASVVSAASLLYVVPDRRTALLQLLNVMEDEGVLLLVETSAAMAALGPGFRVSDYASGRRTWILRLWARARRHGEPVDVGTLCPPGYTVECHPLLGGLVNAWLVYRTA